MTGEPGVERPLPYVVATRTAETCDTATLVLEPVGDAIAAPAPGQFAMLCAPGVGEIAISVSGLAAPPDPALVHTIRDVGAVSGALHRRAPGELVGVRGPFGRGWGLERARGRDVVVVAGGLGLAPLRPVLLAALAARPAVGRVVLVVGARQPSELLYPDQLAAWSSEGVEVHATVDRADTGWKGAVGFVTEPLARVHLDPDRTTAYLCGPEPMMRFGADLLVGRGVPPAALWVSLERSMHCGIALCGHCQLGPLLVCRDGPVVDWAQAGPLLRTREL